MFETDLKVSKAQVLAGFRNITSAIEIASLQLDKTPCMQLDLSQVKAAAQKIEAALEAGKIDDLSNLLGEFGYQLGVFNQNNSHNFIHKAVMTPIEQAAKDIAGGLGSIKKGIETASKAMADKQIKEVVVKELEACTASVETMFAKPKTPTAQPAGAMTDKQC